MSEHPQDHGWRDIYSGLANAINDYPEPLMVLVNTIPGVQSLAPAYIIGLTAISLQQLWHSHGQAGHRQLPGDEIIRLATDCRSELGSILANHRNSFTGVRRFLGPQVLLARHFARYGGAPVNILDIGTGIGILPRQLDSQACFERFAGDLTWPHESPVFGEIGIGDRFGLELDPIPGLAWVHDCYGPSEYYDRLFAEMRETLAIPDVRAANFTFISQDARDLHGLARLMADKNVSAVTAVYSLYQYLPQVRQAIAHTIHRSLPAGGIFIDIEPNPALDQPGCLVEAWIGGVRDKLTVCVVSDGHFRGSVTAAADYDRFTGTWRQ